MSLLQITHRAFYPKATNATGNGRSSDLLRFGRPSHRVLNDSGFVCAKTRVELTAAVTVQEFHLIPS
jgi:hypothetical protein